MWLGPRDVARLAEHLGLSVPDFLTRYTREVAVEGQDEPGISLARAPGGCIFLDEDRNACRVHPARPTQCRAFPFWPANLDSAEAWRREVVALCGERAVAQGHVYTAEEIRDISAPLSTGGAVAPAGRREPGTGEH